MTIVSDACKASSVDGAVIVYYRPYSKRKENLGQPALAYNVFVWPRLPAYELTGVNMSKRVRCGPSDSVLMVGEGD